jgi:hypothetical protein
MMVYFIGGSVTRGGEIDVNRAKKISSATPQQPGNIVLCEGDMLAKRHYS